MLSNNMGNVLYVLTHLHWLSGFGWCSFQSERSSKTLPLSSGNILVSCQKRILPRSTTAQPSLNPACSFCPEIKADTDNVLFCYCRGIWHMVQRIKSLEVCWSVCRRDLWASVSLYCLRWHPCEVSEAGRRGRWPPDGAWAKPDREQRLPGVRSAGKTYIRTQTLLSSKPQEIRLKRHCTPHRFFYSSTLCFVLHHF